MPQLHGDVLRSIHIYVGSLVIKIARNPGSDPQTGNSGQEKLHRQQAGFKDADATEDQPSRKLPALSEQDPQGGKSANVLHMLVRGYT